MKTIIRHDYFHNLSILEYKLVLLKIINRTDPLSFYPSCIVALKRSGWILGAYLSNKLLIPVFTASEIDSIPKYFEDILVVDDKIHKGHAMVKVCNKLKKLNKNLMTACLFVEGEVETDIFIEKTNGIVKMWYEVPNEEIVYKGE